MEAGARRKKEKKMGKKSALDSRELKKRKRRGHRKAKNEELLVKVLLILLGDGKARTSSRPHMGEAEQGRSSSKRSLLDYNEKNVDRKRIRGQREGGDARRFENGGIEKKKKKR